MVDKKKTEEIYEQITKDVKFISKFVKKAQSRQTGEKTVFYDIDIEKMNFSRKSIEIGEKQLISIKTCSRM